MAKSKKNFESCMAELEDILDKIQDEETSLDKSIELYAKAADLIKSCHFMLSDAQIKVEEIDRKINLLEDEEDDI